jgi:arsenite/tail-anchored protein-transporting ATPase
MSDAHVLHFFGGKGGSGKTTLAAAYAMRLAEDAPKHKVLLLSLDGSGALSDVLKKKLSGKPTKLVAGKGEGGLYAAEFDPALVMKPFLAQYVPALQKAATKGAHLSDEDLGKLYTQAVPGLEELVGLLNVVELLEAGSFDRVVLDAAPTAHTLRLFDLPQGLRKFLGLVKGLPEKPAKVKKDVKEPAKELPGAGGFLGELGQRVERLLTLLKDGQRAAFHLVTLGEPVAEAQTRMLYAQLRERAIPVHEVVVNQVEDHTGCPAC